jgi:hypothetical protein
LAGRLQVDILLCSQFQVGVSLDFNFASRQRQFALLGVQLHIFVHRITIFSPFTSMMRLSFSVTNAICSSLTVTVFFSFLLVAVPPHLCRPA